MKIKKVVKKKKAGDPDWTSYKFNYTTTPLPGKFDASAALKELADLVGFGHGGCSSPDNTNHLINNLLVAEIERLRNEIFRLKDSVENYLRDLSKEEA